MAFLLGVIVAAKGCKTAPVIKTIQRPVPTIEYVDRWRTDTVRFVKRQVITTVDTIYREKVVNRLDTLLLIDTVRIVEAWLTEVAKYDTAIDETCYYARIAWDNYQNRTENLTVSFQPKKQPLRWALGVHGLVGLQSDFSENYTPLLAVGLQATVKKTYFGLNYGYNGQHFVGVGVGRNIINR